MQLDYNPNVLYREGFLKTFPSQKGIVKIWLVLEILLYDFSLDGSKLNNCQFCATSIWCITHRALESVIR